MANTAQFGGGPFSFSVPDLAGNVQDWGMAAAQNSWATTAADNQQNYESMMANTSYQRAVASLKAADLNPILAYSNGGAPTPQVGQAQVPNLVGSNGQAHSAFSYDPNYLKQGANIDAATKNTNAQTLATLSGIPGINSANVSKSLQAKIDALDLINARGQQSARDILGDPFYRMEALSGALGKTDVGAGLALTGGVFGGSAQSMAPSASVTPTPTPTTSPGPTSGDVSFPSDY